jgi:hypothetical protein
MTFHGSNDDIRVCKTAIKIKYLKKMSKCNYLSNKITADSMNEDYISSLINFKECAYAEL